MVDLDLQQDIQRQRKINFLSFSREKMNKSKGPTDQSKANPDPKQAKGKVVATIKKGLKIRK